MNLIIGMLLSYLIGSIPTAYVFGKVYRGIDIREHGSGNVGATNAFRVIGKFPGTIVLLLDVLKGVLPIMVIGNVFGLEDAFSRILLGLAVVSGHNWTVFLKFKGGKGIATSLGVLIGLAVQFSSLRFVLLICLLTWACVFLATGYVSLASVIASIILPIAIFFTNQSPAIIVLGVVFCGFVVSRHRTNIKRLLEGSESRVRFPYMREKNK